MLTEKLARFVVETQNVPEPVLRETKVALADTLGVALAGTLEPAAEIALHCLLETGGAPQARIWGTPHLTSAPAAAFVNGIASHALDFDDTMPSLRGHPSATTLPAAVAASEWLGATGRDFLSAYAVGLELAGKLGRAFGSGHYMRGWHATATIGNFTATAVAARVAGLNASQLAQAWGIAAAQSGGLVRNFGTMTKPFQAGHSARAALTAVDLARRGFTASPDIFDGDDGFLSTYAADGEPLAAMADALGKSWELLDRGNNYKRWPCCYCNHRPIGGLLELLDRHSIRTEEVQQIRVGFPPGADEPLIHTNPQTGLEGKFSIEYCAAVTLLDRKLTLETFTDAMVQRPAAQAMMKKVDHYRVPDTKVYSGTVGYTDVELVTPRGRFGQRVEKTPGSVAWPMSAADHEEKFLDCAGRVLGTSGSQRLLDVVRVIETLADMNTLTQAMAPARRDVAAKARMGANK